MKTFVNCSNHPSSVWMKAQLDQAKRYGDVVDVPFPTVACNLEDEQLEELAEKTVNEVMKYHPAAVMCMGEFVVCYRIVQKLKAKGIKVLATSSERKAIERTKEDGTVRKESIFEFQGFREY